MRKVSFAPDFITQAPAAVLAQARALLQDVDGSIDAITNPELRQSMHSTDLFVNVAGWRVDYRLGADRIEIIKAEPVQPKKSGAVWK